MVSNKVHFVEYGKVFIENGATDFQILDNSGDEILRQAGKVRCERFIELGLKFPTPASKTEFTQRVPNISAGFLPLDRGNYLFVQIQRREEGEYALSKKIEPRINRPFNQIRFSLVGDDQLNYYISHGHPLFSSMLYENHDENNLGKDANSLKDYTEEGSTVSPIVLQEIKQYDLWEKLSKNKLAVQYLVNAILDTKRNESSLNLGILAPNTDWKKRLELIEVVQILVWPLIGPFTFALDDISDNKVDVIFSETFRDKRTIINLEKGSIRDLYFDELLRLHEGYRNLFNNDSFIKLLRRYFENGLTIMDSAKLAALVVEPTHEITEDWIRSSQKILASEEEYNLLRSSGLYEVFIRKIQELYLPGVDSILDDNISQIHREVGQHLLNSNYREKVNEYYSNRATLSQAATVSAIEEDRHYLPSDESVRSVYIAPNSLRFFLYLYRIGRLDQIISRTDFSNCSSSTKRATEETITLFEEIQPLITNRDNEERFLSIYEDCYEGMHLLHSGIVAILLNFASYKFSENGIKWSQETLISPKETAFLRKIRLYVRFIHCIQDYYIPNLLELLLEIEQIHVEFGHSLLEKEFVFVLQECYKVGIPFPNSVLISALFTSNLNIVKTDSQFGYLFTKQFLEFFELFQEMIREGISIQHSVLIASVVHHSNPEFHEYQYELIKTILKSRSELNILKGINLETSDVRTVFVANLRKLTLTDELIILLNEVAPLPRIQTDGEAAAPPPIFPKPITVSTHVPPRLPDKNEGRKKFFSSWLVRLLIVVSIGAYGLIYWSVSITPTPSVAPFWSSILTLLGGLVTALMLTYIPTLAARIVRDTNKAFLAFMEILLFTIVICIVAILLFKFKGNGVWIIYSIATISILDIGAHIIDYVRERTLKRVYNNRQYRLLLTEAKSFENMLEREKLLYIALPAGIIVGTLIGVFTKKSQLVIFLLCIRIITLIASPIQLFFIVKSIQQMIIPMYYAIIPPRIKPIFSLNERKNFQKEEHEILSSSIMSTDLRKLYLFDISHNILLLIIFILTFSYTYGFVLGYQWIVILILASMMLFSQFPYTIGQYFLHQKVLDWYEGLSRAEINKWLNENIPLFPTFDFLTAIFASGTAGGLILYLLDNFIKELFK